MHVRIQSRGKNNEIAMQFITHVPSSMHQELV